MRQTHPASLGIDVAKAKFDAALLCEGKLAQRTFSMDPAGFATLVQLDPPARGRAGPCLPGSDRGVWRGLGAGPL